MSVLLSVSPPSKKKKKEEVIIVYDSASTLAHLLFTFLPTSPWCVCTAAASGISRPQRYHCSQTLLTQASPQFKGSGPRSWLEATSTFLTACHGQRLYTDADLQSTSCNISNFLSVLIAFSPAGPCHVPYD